MNEHSPVPWSLGDRVHLEDPNYHMHGGQAYRQIKDGRTDIIALVIDDEDDPECQANVLLMKAAPRFLELLEDAIVAWPEFDTDESIPGTDAVEWLGNFLQDAKREVAKAKEG